MKTPIKSILLAATLAAFGGGIAHAQISPGSYTPSGLAFSGPGANTALFLSHYNPYYLHTTVNQVMPAILTWNNTAAEVNALFDPLGGTVRATYIGKTAGWSNDFGYIWQPTAPPYYSILEDINNNGLGLNGHSVYLDYGVGQKLDFFVNTPDTISFPNLGGLYYAFGTPDITGDAIMHVHRLLFFMDGVEYNGSIYNNVPTVLVGWEDAQDGAAPYYDGDYNDLIMAFQFFEATAVPEPSTYGLIGAAVLLGIAGYRRFKAKPKAAT